MAGFFFLIALAAISYYFWLSKRSNRETATTAATILEAVASDTHINLIFGECPLVTKDGERIIAALPNTALQEPLIIRTREGHRYRSSFRTGRASWGSSSYTSELAPHDELREIDIGIFILTDQRVVFMGGLKTLILDLKNILGVDHHADGITIHCEGKEDVESFKISNDLKIPYLKDGKAMAVALSGPVLERIVNREMARSRIQHAASAA